jgi:chromate transporter
MATKQDSGYNASALKLFAGFLRLGLTSFGGPAMVAYIRDLAVKRKQWVSAEMFQDGAALCQSIPGATAMQTAAYVGLRAGGPVGALAAFVGFGLPAFVLMVVLSAAYQAGRDLQPVLAAFRGLQVIVIAIMANAAFSFGRSSIKNWRDAVLSAGAAALLILRINPILAIVGSAAVAAVLYRGVNLPGPKPQSSQPLVRHLMRWPVAIVLLVGGTVGAMFFLDRRLFDLATIMLRIDLFAFGGGFASVPLMLHEIVDVRGWLESRTFMDGIALGQVTPGPIVITATFVGYQIAGLAGALVGTVGIFTPSFLMVLLAVPYLDRLQHSLLFRRAMRGILASFVGLLLAVAINFSQAASWTVPGAILALAALAALRLKVDILWVVLAGASIAIFVL